MTVLDLIRDDLLYLVDHVHKFPDEAVRRWSDRVCNDYQLPLLALFSLLESSRVPDPLVIEDTPEDLAVIDIITNSTLRHVLEYDAEQRCVRYQPGIDHATRQQISDFLRSLGGIGSFDVWPEIDRNLHSADENGKSRTASGESSCGHA